MAIHIEDKETEELVRRFGSLRGLGLKEAVRTAIEESLAADEEAVNEHADDLWQRLKPLRDKIASWPKTGLKADKAFFDSLYEEPHGDFSKTDMAYNPEDER